MNESGSNIASSGLVKNYKSEASKVSHMKRQDLMMEDYEQIETGYSQIKLPDFEQMRREIR
jgi:hypothetical protein